MKQVGVWASCLALGMAVARMAQGQPQDDAALADAPDEKPASKPWPGLASSSTTRRSEPELQDADSEPPMTTDELRKAYPDVQFQTTPPVSLTIFLNFIYPFQELGVGCGLDVYVLPRLRLSALGTVGATVDVNGTRHASLYADTGIGVAVLRFPGRSIANIRELPGSATHKRRSVRTPFERAMFGDDRPDAPFIHAIVPASHSIELEAGLFSGRYPLYRCTANCDQDPSLVKQTKEDASLQVTALYAGIRYVYFSLARSEQMPFRSLSAFEVAVDAVSNPFAPPDRDLFNVYDHHPSHNPVGARMTLRMPTIRCTPTSTCLGMNLMGGYLPSPSDGMFSLNLVVQ